MTRKIFNGKVIRISNHWTAVVEVKTFVRHPRYHKIISRSAKHSVHFESIEIELGQMVKIESCRPLSKNKKWMLVSRVSV